MSRFLQLLNRLKVEARTDFLTDSQRAAMEEIHAFWEMPERVNLIGACGAGKTFLGWTLARIHNASFIPDSKMLHGSGSRVADSLVVDNVSSDERPLRALLAELQLSEVRSAVLISSDANRLGMPVVELELPSPEDIDIVYHNLSLLEHYALEPLTQGSLWDVIYSTLTISHSRGAI